MSGRCQKMKAIRKGRGDISRYESVGYANRFGGLVYRAYRICGHEFGVSRSQIVADERFQAWKRNRERRARTQEFGVRRKT